jgi:hypothetical protein
MDNVSIIINSVVSLRQFLPSRSLVFSVGDIVGLAGEEGKHLGQLPSFCRLQRVNGMIASTGFIKLELLSAVGLGLECSY